MATAERPRTDWIDLPPAVHDLVAEILDAPVTSAISQMNGFSPGSADRVSAANGRRAFVKAVHRDRNLGAFDLHRREIDVMAVLPSTVSAPALLGSYNRDGWVALILDDVDGRHPGHDGDGSDTWAVLDAFATFPRVDRSTQGRLPRVFDDIATEARGWREIADDGAVDLLPEWAQARLTQLRDAADAAPTAADGEYLQHLDSRADNVLIDATQKAWIIDWPWASVGARWVDGLMYLFDCRVRGEAVDSDAILRTHPIFEGVDASAINSMLSSVTGGFFNKARQPSPPNMPALREFQRKEGIAGADWLRERWG
jgi:aminoglycoside phosphotransferase (APT) family kinase protein